MTNSLPPAAMLESLLFVSSGPVAVGRLALALELTTQQVQALLAELAAAYATRGIRLQVTADGVQLTTAPEAGALIERFLGLELSTRLSQAALETLAIVAYMQPITRPTIDQVRGVNSDGALRTLLSKGLIQELGRQESPGRPILYGTTADFLQHFGHRKLWDYIFEHPISFFVLHLRGGLIHLCWMRACRVVDAKLPPSVAANSTGQRVTKRPFPPKLIAENHPKTRQI